MKGIYVVILVLKSQDTVTHRLTTSGPQYIAEVFMISRWLAPSAETPVAISIKPVFSIYKAHVGIESENKAKFT